MSTKIAAPLAVLGKLMKTPGLARRAGAGAAVGAAGGAAAGADGQGGGLRGALGGAALGAVGGAASSRLMRRNVGRAMKGGTIKTRALKPAYNAPGAGARAKANIVAGQAKRKGNIAARQQAVATGAQQQATAAAGRQRALAGPGATGLGKMPAVGGPQGSAGYRAGQAAGGALRGVGQAMAGARRAGAGIAAAPGRAMSKLRTGVSSGVSNISRGFRAGATKTAILRPGLSAARRLTAAGMKSKEPIKGAVGTMTSAGKSLKKAIVQGDRHPAVGGALSRMHAQKAQKTLSKGNLDRRLQRVAHRPGAKAHSAISKAEGVSETANRYAG